MPDIAAVGVRARAEDLLQQAKRQHSLGWTEKAKGLLRQVIADYPDSRESEIARTMLDGMRPERERAQIVRVVDLDISFGQMVMLMLKWSIAAIPALIILTVLGVFVSAVLGAVFAGLIAGIR